MPTALFLNVRIKPSLQQEAVIWSETLLWSLAGGQLLQLLLIHYTEYFIYFEDKANVSKYLLTILV